MYKVFNYAKKIKIYIFYTFYDIIFEKLMARQKIKYR